MFGGFETPPLVGNAGKKRRHYIPKPAFRQYQFSPIFLGLFLAEAWPGFFGVLLKSYRFKTLYIKDLIDYSTSRTQPLSPFSNRHASLERRLGAPSSGHPAASFLQACSQAGSADFIFCRILPICPFRLASSRVVTVPFSNNTSPPTMVRITSEALAEWTIAVTGEYTGTV